jgi:DNA-binding transcriptional regulator YiaG
VPYKTKAKALKQPTAAEIKEVRTLTGLTQQKAAELVHRADGARWREWEAGKYQIDLAVWEVFLLKTGLREVEIGLAK